LETNKFFQQPQGVAQAIKVNEMKISIAKYFKRLANILLFLI